MSLPDLSIATTVAREDAEDFYRAGGGSYYFERDTSWTAKRLAGSLRGGRKADPSSSGTAIRLAEELEKQLEAIAVLRELPPAPEPTEPRPVPPEGDLPAMLSDAGRDARYVEWLTANGAAMSIRNVPQALRVVRLLRPKLEAIWAIYETLPKPERVELTSEAKEEFWRRMDALAEGRT